jgi:predicted ATPase
MIKQVTIKNFKALRNASISLSNLTVFTGINGMGKSTFIQALLLLRQSHLEKRLPKLLLLNSEKYVSLGKSKDVFNFHADYEESIEIKLETTLLGKIDIKTNDRTGRAWLNIDSYLPKEWLQVENEPLFIDKKEFQYLQAERVSPKSTYGTDEYEVVELRNLGNKGEFTAHFIAKHKDEKVKLPSLINKSGKSDNLLAQLDTWLSKITKGVRLISNLDESANSARISYQFDDGDDLTPEFSPVNVGFGLTYVLPVLVAVLSAKPGDLVIIENPESHLHPTGQSAIGYFLSLAAQDGLQLIVETHSDHLMHGIRIATKEHVKNQLVGIDSENVAIFYFNRESQKHNTEIHSIRVDNKGKLYQITQDGKKTASLPKGFSDEWATNMGKLI